MQFFKHWTRQTAITMLISGIIFAAVAVIAGLYATADSGSLYGMLVGIAAALGIFMTVAGIVWLVKWRGKTNEEVQAALHQIYDERYYSTLAKANMIAAHVAVAFLLICAVVFALQDNLLVTWLFIGCSYIIVFGRLILTRVMLRVN